MESNTTAVVNDLEHLMLTIYEHVREKHAPVYEGGASLEEATYLRELAATSDAKLIAEVGFNVGFSSLAFLESSPDAKVISFEIDRRISVELAKGFIDERYPGRHELVIGNSLETLPEYAEAGRELVDLAFVDGGHDFEVALADIENARKIAKPGALIVVDDLTPWFPWGMGPHQAWHEAIDRGLIEAVEYVVEGVVVKEVTEPGAGRVWAYGRFVADPAE